MGAMSRLLASTCANLYLRPTLPAKAFCREPTRKWPSGADTKKPYRAILNALASICARASALESVEASFGVGLGGRPAAFDPMTSWRNENVATMVMNQSYAACPGTESRRCDYLRLSPWYEGGSWRAGPDTEPAKSAMMHSSLGWRGRGWRQYP